MFIRNLALLTLAAIALAGCRRDDVKVYHVAKDDSAAPSQNQMIASEQNSTTQPQLQWTLPDGWQEKTPGQMRVASFTVTGTNGEIADVGVIPLPTTGQEIQLVNMWREQLQLPAATNSDIPSETVAIGSDSGKLFDLASDALLIDGKSRARILVAMMTSGGTSWFFKMTGEDSFVAAQKENFLQFLKSVSFVENVPVRIATSIPQADLKNQSTNSIWTIPPDWKQIDPGAMLFAKFSIASSDGNASVNVSALAGDGGGVEPNVNRWRAQIGLPPATESDFLTYANGFTPVISPVGILDFTGTDAKTGKPARLVGAIILQNGQTWFYKLMGDPDIVAQQKDAFIKFIQSANYANAR